MKKRNLLKIFTGVITLFAFLGVAGNVDAAYKTPYQAQLMNDKPIYDYAYTTVPYGSDYNTAKFSLKVTAADGTQLASNAPGICMLPDAKRPAVNTVWKADVYPDGTSKPPELYEIDNSELIKYLYYGLCPTGCTRDVANEVFRSNNNRDITDDNRVVLVHNALSYINAPSQWTTGLNNIAQRDTLAFIRAANQLPVPDGVFAYRVGNKVAQSLGFIYTDVYNLKINKRTTPNGSGVSLAKAKYRIYSDENCRNRAVKDKTGAYYDDLVTDRDGNTQDVQVVAKRKYWIKEESLPLVEGTNLENDNFKKDTTCHLCDLVNNDSCTVTSVDEYTTPEPDKGMLKIIKVDEEGNSLGNQTDYAIFKVYEGAKDASTNKCNTTTEVASLAINNTEAARDTGYILTPGQPYCISEVQTPTGYEPVGDFDFTISPDGPLFVKIFRVTNFKTVKGSVTVRKVDDSNNPLAGAKFGIYKNEDCSGNPFKTIISGSDGTASYGNLDIGSYCLKEISAPKGYIIDSSAHPFDITDAQKNYVLTDPIVNVQARGKLIIYKTLNPDSHIAPSKLSSDHYSYSGAVFNVYRNNCYTGQLETTTPPIPEGQNYIIVDDLEKGTYCIAEKNEPKGFYKTEATETVVVNADDIAYAVIQDMPKLGTVQLVKSTTNKAVKDSDPKKYSLAGAQFQIRDAKGTPVGYLTVDADGNSNTLRDLPYGKYYATEITAPTSGSYKIIDNTDNKNILPVEITADKPNGVFYAVDEFVPGKAYVNKVPAEKPDGSCTLKGAEYAICLDEDCREVAKNKDGKNIILVTDEKGNTQTEELNPGVYYFKETKAPECFEINPEAQKIIVASGETVKVTSKEELIPQNPKTGVDNPYLVTIATVAIGGAGLYFLRRKNAFRQI